MKKSLVSALAAAALVLGLAACGSTKVSEPPAPPQPALPEGVTAEWDFVAKQPGKGAITTDYKTFIADFPLPPSPESTGATLVLTQGSETKYLNEASAAGDVFLAFNNRGSVTLADPTNSKASFILTLENPGTVELIVAGNSESPAPSRLTAIVDASGKVLAGKDQLAKSPIETVIAENLPAGTYTIYADGSRLYKVSIKK